MKPFKHISVKTPEEAASALNSGDAVVISGGTDLLCTLKDNILPTYPKTVINLKTISGLDYIKEEAGMLKIGAMTHLEDIHENSTVLEKYTALAQAAKAVATPHIRTMGTIGGSLAQLPRCWYFRKAENRFPCLRKGGSECFAITGDNRFHSIFGGRKTKPAPCSGECPAGTDIPAYMAMLRNGEWDAAAERIMERNPIPVVTSRVCAHFCQSGCNRGGLDESVTISGVERAIGDYILANADKFYKKPERETGKSVAIVGSGPAGLAAAFYLRKAGNKVKVYDSMTEAGGMLMYAIPAYRLPKDLVQKVIDAFKAMGIEFITSTKIGKDITPEQLEKDYDSVCYATGTWKRPVVGISGEGLTVFGLDFLVGVKDWMNGKIGKEVFVMGGGNVAMDVAVTAKRLGANKVTLACLEPRDRMPASAEEIARAEEEGVVIMPGWGLSRVVEESGKVSGMELKRCTTPWDETGAFNPQYNNNDITTVKAQNILMAIGQQVDLSFLDDKYQLQLTNRGLIDVAAETSATSRQGVFGAGDATTGPGTVVGAVATGRRASAGINRYLNTTLDSISEKTSQVDFDHKGLEMKKTMINLREMDSGKRKLDIEDTQSPAKEEAVDEAARCLNCGCYAVSPSDLAPALIALGAQIVTSKRTIDSELFFKAGISCSTCLDSDEIITEVQIPAPKSGEKSAFVKYAYRKSIDFPVVNCAVALGEKPRIVLGAVAPTPYRAYAAENVLAGGDIDESLAEKAGDLAAKDANPLEKNKYKAQLVKVLTKRAIIAASE